MNCIECKTEPIYIKKRGLCRKCYRKLYQRGNFRKPITEEEQVNLIESEITNQTSKKVHHMSEIHFVRNYFTHKNWLYQPATFRIGLLRYSPDFYDAERNVFIEVVGTRQAFHKNKEKCQVIFDSFPGVQFEYRTENGDLLDKNNPQWNNCKNTAEEKNEELQ